MGRNHQIDFFRGFLLVLITFNHFISENNVLIRFTSEGIGWITGAFGFVFLSGFTVGLVYTNKFRQKGEEFTYKTAYNRAWLVYKYHIVVLLLTIGLLFTLGYVRQYWEQPYTAMLTKPALAAGLGALLLYQPRNLDVLPMYTLFLLFVPWIIISLHKGTTSQLRVLVVSLILYLIGTFQIIQISFEQFSWGKWVDTGTFDILSWQLIFVAGIFLGYISFDDKLSSYLNRPFVLYSAIAVTLLFFIHRNLLTPRLVEPKSIEQVLYWTSRKYLRPPRLLNIAAIFVIIRHLMVRYPNWFQYRPLMYLGKNSIEVFSFHIVVVILLRPINPYLNRIFSLPAFGKYYFFPLETLLAFVVVASLFLAPTIWEKSSYYYKKIKLLRGNNDSEKLR
ncbi:OpgC domain-containing protein [Telluribacter humicola]|uniref:OpgC domain-containing protein n=1 Tax=Telluribacter humicola TaxID=1720261 RepID=UPI001A95C349|nr:OpgC domain-containing protein [Telluribacter humicola]